jgi:hypothetical protein
VAGCAARGGSGYERDTTAAGFPNTPEGAFQSFVLAMGLGHEVTLRDVVLPADGFKWLLEGDHVTSENVPAFRAALGKMKMRRLSAGEKITLPGGHEVTVRPQEVTGDSVLLLVAETPIPVHCMKIEGRWRIDARTFIAGRKAAAEARKRTQ